MDCAKKKKLQNDQIILGVHHQRGMAFDSSCVVDTSDTGGSSSEGGTDDKTLEGGASSRGRVTTFIMSLHPYNNNNRPWGVKRGIRFTHNNRRY